MNKSEIYNWRIDPDLKKRLQAAARSEGLSMAAAIELATQEWLLRRADAEADESRQRRLHAIARSLVGVHDVPDIYSKEKLRRRVLNGAARRKSSASNGG